MKSASTSFYEQFILLHNHPFIREMITTSSFSLEPMVVFSENGKGAVIHQLIGSVSDENQDWANVWAYIAWELRLQQKPKPRLACFIPIDKKFPFKPRVPAKARCTASASEKIEQSFAQQKPFIPQSKEVLKTYALLRDAGLMLGWPLPLARPDAQQQRKTKKAKMKNEDDDVFGGMKTNFKST